MGSTSTSTDIPPPHRVLTPSSPPLPHPAPFVIIPLATISGRSTTTSCPSYFWSPNNYLSSITQLLPQIITITVTCKLFYLSTIGLPTPCWLHTQISSTSWVCMCVCVCVGGGRFGSDPFVCTMISIFELIIRSVVYTLHCTIAISFTLC